MVDAIVKVQQLMRLCLIATATGSFALLCCTERASADPAAAVQGTSMVTPGLALGLSHPSVVAAAAPPALDAAATPVADPFATITRRVNDLYRNGLDISSEDAPERVHVFVRSNRGGGHLCLRYEY
jgi:hypothetical protein